MSLFQLIHRTSRTAPLFYISTRQERTYKWPHVARPSASRVLFSFISSASSPTCSMKFFDVSVLVYSSSLASLTSRSLSFFAMSVVVYMWYLSTGTSCSILFSDMFCFSLYPEPLPRHFLFIEDPHRADPLYRGTPLYKYPHIGFPKWGTAYMGVPLHGGTPI